MNDKFGQTVLGGGTFYAAFQDRPEVDAETCGTQLVVEEIGQPREPDQRRHHHGHAQVGLGLHGVVLARAGGLKGVGVAPEDAHRVEAHDLVDVLHGGDVLPPLAGGEVPEDRKHPQGDEGPHDGGVHLVGLGKAEPLVGAVDLEAGDQHADDEHGLGPVPQAFEAREEINPFHDACASVSVLAAQGADGAVDEHAGQDAARGARAALPPSSWLGRRA